MNRHHIAQCTLERYCLTLLVTSTVLYTVSQKKTLDFLS